MGVKNIKASIFSCENRNGDSSTHMLDMVGFLETGYKIRNSNSSYMLDMVSEPEVVGTSSLCHDPHSRSEATIVVVLVLMMAGFTKFHENYDRLI